MAISMYEDGYNGQQKPNRMQIKNFEQVMAVFSNKNIKTIKLNIPHTLKAEVMKLLENLLMSTVRDKFELVIYYPSPDIDKIIVRLISVMNSWIKSFNLTFITAKKVNLNYQQLTN